MVSRSFGRPPNPKKSCFSELRAFAEFCGGLFCGRFAGVLRVILGGENVKRDQFCNLTNI